MSADSPPAPLHPEFQLLIDEIAAAEANGGPRWEELSIPELRAFSKDFRKTAEPIAGVTASDLEIALETVRLFARLYVPDGAAAVGPGLVYFHGGGFAIGSVETHDAIVSRLAVASGTRILSVDYRLAPEHPFPAAHNDTLQSVRWAFDHSESLGFDRDRIAVGGDSAGANLAASACLDLRRDSERRVAFLLLLYPNTTIEGASGSRATYADGHYLTLSAANHLFRQYIRSPAQSSDPRIDLLNRPDLDGLPPTYLAFGTCDILHDECAAFAASLRAAGVPLETQVYPGFIHGFFGFAHRAPAVLDAFEQAGGAIASALHVAGKKSRERLAR